MNTHDGMADQEVVGNLADFDVNSGSRTERILFNNRLAILSVCLLVTLAMCFLAARLRLNASFEAMIPTGHPYIANYLAHKRDLAGLGNTLRIAVENTQGDIYDTGYLATLQKLNDALFLLPGVDRAQLKSLWTPSTRWIGVTEEGLEGGPVMPLDYAGTPDDLVQLRRNVERSGEIGQLVAFDGRSSIILVPLLAAYPDGTPLDYARVNAGVEALRERFQSDRVRIHVTGFVKVVGELIAGVRAITLFFAAAVLLAAVALYVYTRCVRSTLLVVACSLAAVVWQLGLLTLFGYELDPYSVLVPFLVFAIGMSHGAQKMNGIMQDIGRGTHRVVAARHTFRRLFLAGLTALLCDAVGFAVLTIIQIRAIQHLAVIASVGVAVLIFTNLILLPILLSFVGVSPAAARRSLRTEIAEQTGARNNPLWHFLGLFTQRTWALPALCAAALFGAGGYLAGSDLKIGDLDPGAPELRPDSTYNRDVAFLGSHYGASSDVFAVMVTTPEGACAAYDTLMRIDALEQELLQQGGVDSTHSLAQFNRRVIVGLNEGDPRWSDLLHNQDMLNAITARAPRGLDNDTCSLQTVYIYLTDHKADTLARVVAKVETFAAANNTDQARFLLAAGNAGIEAATNSVVKEASRAMLYWIYGAVVLLCLVAFRSWRAVACAVLPLILTSVLCEALMVRLGIGVKVGTLPVIALGVGIGVDYALYVMSIMLAELRRGASLSEAYHRALLFTGKVVILTSVTLAVGVATWSFSPIKFQADMGILLAFMFVWNMLGALVLLPALACFLLQPRQ
jgi:predicted RND superfamily exporter protein